MKRKDLDKIIDNSPQIKIIFQLVKLPNWLDKDELIIGENLYYYDNMDTYQAKNDHLYHLPPQYIEFVKYEIS